MECYGVFLRASVFFYFLWAVEGPEVEVEVEVEVEDEDVTWIEFKIWAHRTLEKVALGVACCLAAKFYLTLRQVRRSFSVKSENFREDLRELEEELDAFKAALRDRNRKVSWADMEKKQTERNLAKSNEKCANLEERLAEAKKRLEDAIQRTVSAERIADALEGSEEGRLEALLELSFSKAATATAKKDAEKWKAELSVVEGKWRAAQAGREENAMELVEERKKNSQLKGVLRQLVDDDNSKLGDEMKKSDGGKEGVTAAFDPTQRSEKEGQAKKSDGIAVDLKKKKQRKKKGPVETKGRVRLHHHGMRLSAGEQSPSYSTFDETYC
ncbi:hypothetical protein BSKO_01493 [Bryopsis sp. KO-2023]|nr:hypothetical protein BSKO_01493 [Bryopsis sp. KO-2023]